jgi:hypothetical protein
MDFCTMRTTTLSNDVFNYSTFDPASISSAFLAHVKRFEQQDRDVSWQDARATFAAVSGDSADEDTFRAAMEDLLDSGAIVVERLPDGSNRLVTGD